MRAPNPRAPAALAVLIATLGACASTPPELETVPEPVTSVPEAPVPTPGPPRLGVIHVASGVRAGGVPPWAGDTALRDAVRDADVVYVGESHDDPDHHALQVEVLRRLHDVSGGKAMLGMEMFQRPYQEHLDAYVAGKIDELEMLRRTEYFGRWNFDYTLYAGLWRLCRERGIPIVALNVSRDLTRPVGRGGLGSLTPEQRAQLPADIDFEDPVHRARIEAIFTTGAHPVPAETLENMYQAMTVWDEVMAESAADRLAAAPAGSKMLVIAGKHHIEGRTGIPARVARRLPGRTHLVIGARSARRDGKDPMTDAQADGFVLFTDAPAKLGVRLKTLDDGGLEILSVAEGSTAAAAGALVGDVVVGIATDHLHQFGGGKPVSPVADLTDLRYLLDAAQVGQGVRLTVRRGEEELVLHARLRPAPPETAKP